MVSPLVLDLAGERLATVVAFDLVLVVYEQSCLPVQAMVVVPKEAFLLALGQLCQPLLDPWKSLRVHPMAERQLLVLEF